MSKVAFSEVKKGEHDIPKHNPMLTQFLQASSGASSGFLTRFLTQPFDVLKIRFQLQVEPVSRRKAKNKPTAVKPKYTSMWQATRLIYREEGIRALWKGHNSGQLLTIVYTVFQFWTYEQVNLALRHNEYLNESKNFRKFLSGGLAGMVGTTIAMPFDVIRTRVIGQDPHVTTKSLFSLIPHIVQSEGVHGIFRGWGTSIIQIGPLIGFNFMFYHQFNDIYMKFVTTDNSRPPVIWGLINGCAAGVISKIMVYPLDFIKKRLQLQGFQHSRQTFGRNQICADIKECIKLTLKEEGLLGFYKGMYPTLFKSGLTTGLYFTFYDMFKKFWLGDNEDE